MDVLLDWQHYHRLNITLLSVIGLWPYGNKFILRLKRFFASFFVVVSCFSQLATFLTVDYTRVILLRNIPRMFVGCAITVKFTSFLVASDCIRRITKSINGEWKGLSSKEEIRIIKKYVERGKFHTKGFAMLICPLGACLIVLPLSSLFLDIVMPLKQARSRNLPIMLELFFDQKKHFFLAAFLLDGALIVGGLVLISTEALVIVYIQHACALFKVTSRRIKKLLCSSAVRDSKSSSNMDVIGEVVSIHCRAIRYCKLLKEGLFPSYSILLLFGILSLSAHILRCTQTFASHEFIECLISMLFSFAILGYIFYVNFMVQNILDLSSDIFDDLYNTAWCDVPISTRKLILFCMINCIKPVTIDACGLFVPCYKTFAMILRMTLSYATALFSLQ